MNDAPHHFDRENRFGYDEGLTPNDLSPVWDAVLADNPLLIEHITGPHRHVAIGLAQIVRAFHDHAVRLRMPIHTGLLLAMFGQHPEGAFASRVGTELFAKDVGALWQECIDKLHAENLKAAKEAEELASYLTISDEPWDEDALPPPPWLAPPYLMRQEITLLHGLGAAGKSMLIIIWAIALALGRRFGRLEPAQRLRVILTNFEEKAAEQMRRISAALRFFGATPADLQGWLYRVSLGPKGDVTMFELDDNGVHTTACWRALETVCEQIKPDAVALDPFIAINAVPENDNQLMRRVMTVMKLGLAQRFDCALLLAHHDAKGAGENEDSDQGNARGAGDIVFAARFELAVRKMTAAQAKQMGIETARRGFYFRVGSAASKINYAEPQDSEWFERLSVLVARAPAVYCIPWQPKGGKLTAEMADTLLAAIREGTDTGPYSPQLGDGARSLGPIFDGLGIKGSRPQRAALQELKDTHGVVEAAWKIPNMGDRTRKGLRTAGGFPDNYKWQDREDEEPEPC